MPGFFSDDDETDTVDGSTSQKIRQKKENNSSVAAKSATPPSFKESRFFHGNRYSLTFIFVLSFLFIIGQGNYVGICIFFK